MHNMMICGKIITLHDNYVITNNYIFKHDGNIRFEDIQNMLEYDSTNSLINEELIAPEDAELVQ